MSDNSISKCIASTICQIKFWVLLNLLLEDTAVTVLQRSQLRLCQAGNFRQPRNWTQAACLQFQLSKKVHDTAVIEHCTELLARQVPTALVLTTLNVSNFVMSLMILKYQSVLSNPTKLRYWSTLFFES